MDAFCRAATKFARAAMNLPTGSTRRSAPGSAPASVCCGGRPRQLESAPLSVAGKPPSGSSGEVSERLKEHAWKVCKRLNRASGVRIPLSPPAFQADDLHRAVTMREVSMVAPSAPRDARSKIPPGPEGSNGIDRRGCRGQPAGSSPICCEHEPKFAAQTSGPGFSPPISPRLSPRPLTTGLPPSGTPRVAGAASRRRLRRSVRASRSARAPSLHR